MRKRMEFYVNGYLVASFPLVGDWEYMVRTLVDAVAPADRISILIGEQPK